MSAFEPEPENAAAGLRHYLDVVRRRKWIVLGVTAVCVAAAVALSLLQSPVYRAETKIVIGQGGGLVQPGFANSIQPYTATMSDLIASDIVAKNVVDSLGLNMTPHELLAKVTTSINPQTAVVNVFVDDHDRQQAVRIDQEVAAVFSQLVQDRFGRVAGAATGTNQPLTAKVFDPAHLLPGRVSPRPARNVAIAIVLGLILGLVAAFLREHFDRGLRTREAVEQAFGVPVIGQVPFTTRAKEARVVAFAGRGETAEAFRGLRANLQYLAVQRPLRTILVTSASPEQGKTTVAANLAVAIARAGSSVAVVDADLRRPRLESAFGIESNGTGLTNVLVGTLELGAALRDVELPQEQSRKTGRLSVIPSGPLPPNPADLLTSAQMTALLDRVAAQYEFVIVDSPPVLLVADALELAREVDGVILVVRHGSASTDEGRELRATVERLGIHLVGAVMTDVEPLRQYGTYGDDDRPKRPPKPKQSKKQKPAPEREPAPAAASASDEVF